MKKNYILMLVLGLNDIKYYISGDSDLLNKSTVVVNEIYDSFTECTVENLDGIDDIVIGHRDNCIIINNHEYKLDAINYLSLVEVDIETDMNI